MGEDVADTAGRNRVATQSALNLDIADQKHCDTCNQTIDAYINHCIRSPCAEFAEASARTVWLPRIMETSISRS